MKRKWKDPEAEYDGQHLSVYREDEGFTVRDRNVRVGNMSQPFDWIAAMRLKDAIEYIQIKEALEQGAVLLSQSDIAEIVPMLQQWDSEYGRGEYPAVVLSLEQSLINQSISKGGE